MFSASKILAPIEAESLFRIVAFFLGKKERPKKLETDNGK
jgi:hypothetical protein